MKKHEDAESNAAPPPKGEPRERCELFLLRAGRQAFAVFAEEVECVTQSHAPVALPHAPRAVLGLVCIRGRMRTVLDPPALIGVHEEPIEQAATERASTEQAARVGTSRFIIALRGDEQLALAADQVEGPIAFNAEALAAPDPHASILRATLEHDGARILVLEPSRLFDNAMQRTERRRQRSSDK
jgi:chemotaxis signal transduction protein